jgi:DUF1365 family protein
MMGTSALYFGQVTHRRLRPKSHRLAYRVFSMLIDLDELEELNRTLRLFAHNRAGLFSMHDRDHGDGTVDLRRYLETQLAAAGIVTGSGPIRMLCYPRLLGFVFNPITVYFCHRHDGTVAAMIYQVDNTFGDRHSYLIPVPVGAKGPVRQECAKMLHVSPFMSMEMTYRFRIAPPGASVAVAVEAADAEGPILEAMFAGHRVELTDRNLARAFLRYPLMTLKVIAGIHWEAFRLWRMGMRFNRRPLPPAYSLTIVAPAQSAEELLHVDA